MDALMSGQIMTAMGIIEQRFRAIKASFLERQNFRGIAKWFPKPERPVLQ